MVKSIEISGDEFRRMQLIELDMLKEFDGVCRRNNINYSIIGGTLLGSVRHGGYIPWDDDADIGMLREDYEKFKKVAYQLDESICYFQDHSTDPEYRWGYGKLRRTGTTFVRTGQEHLKCKTGVFVDVFPLDDVPKSVLGQMFQDFRCFCLRKIMWSEVGRLADSEGPFMRKWYALLSKIDIDWVFSRLKKMENKSSNGSTNKVRILTFKALGKLYIHHPIHERYGMPKEWFLDTVDYEFEDTKLLGVRDYDAFLKYMFDDYMTLPPEENRQRHSPVSSYSF